MTTETSVDLPVSVLADLVARVEHLTPEEIARTITICDHLVAIFAESRRSIGEFLAQGMNAKEFATKYEKGLHGLESILTGLESAVAHYRDKALPPPADECLSRFHDVIDEMLGLRQFIKQAVDKAKLPHRPVDGARLEEARKAYERGETKPFERMARS